MSRLFVVLACVGVAGTAGGAPPVDPLDPRARARSALCRLPGKLKVHWQARRSRPTMIRGLEAATSGDGPVERARRFVAGHPDLFMGRGDCRLRRLDVRRSRDLVVVRLRQHCYGLPVEGGLVSVALDRADRVRSVRSALEPVALASSKPRITPATAVASARRAIGAARGPGHAELVILARPTARLAYRVLLPWAPTGRVHLVDARDGRYLASRRAVLAEGVGR